MAMVVGAVMSWGLASTGVEGGFAIASWRVMFLLLGAVTMALGVILFIFLPDSPLNARFLDKEERLLAVERIRSNQSGIGNKASSGAPSQRLALTSPSSRRHGSSTSSRRRSKIPW